LNPGPSDSQPDAMTARHISKDILNNIICKWKTIFQGPPTSVVSTMNTSSFVNTNLDDITFEYVTSQIPNDPRDPYYLKNCYVCSAKSKPGVEFIHNYGGLVKTIPLDAVVL